MGTYQMNERARRVVPAGPPMYNTPAGYVCRLTVFPANGEDNLRIRAFVSIRFPSLVPNANDAMSMVTTREAFSHRV